MAAREAVYVQSIKVVKLCPDQNSNFVVWQGLINCRSLEPTHVDHPAERIYRIIMEHQNNNHPEFKRIIVFEHVTLNTPTHHYCHYHKHILYGMINKTTLMIPSSPNSDPTPPPTTPIPKRQGMQNAITPTTLHRLLSQRLDNTCIKLVHLWTRERQLLRHILWQQLLQLLVSAWIHLWHIVALRFVVVGVLVIRNPELEVKRWIGQ